MWSKRGEPRVELLNCLQRILLPIIGICVTLSVGVASTQAALLNDIRVGEYPTYTRIVFEFSTAAPIKFIVPQQPGQLSIEFTATQPQLNRKIPLDRTQRIKDIKLLYRQAHLSANLTFAFKDFRYEVTEFKQPDRIVLDIYQLAATPEPPTSSIGKETVSAIPGTHAITNQLPIISNHTHPLKPLPSAGAADSLRTAPSQVPDPKTEQPAASTHPPTIEKTAPATMPVRPAKEPAQVDKEKTPMSVGYQGLQFYLVIGLVVLTIVILILLLIMLLSKQRWTDDQAQLNAGDYLQKQDEHIAKLDTQIHEQLKRYDEA